MQLLDILFCVKNTFVTKNKNCGILRNIQTYYGCVENALSGMLHIHALLWLTNASNPNELIQLLEFDKTFEDGLLKYLDNIIVQSLPIQKELNINELTDFDWDTIHPCSTMPPNSKDINFKNIYTRNLHKMLNTCNCHVCNPACYKNIKDASEKLCRYGFPHVVIDKHIFLMKQSCYT